jgi:hypothetical protein
MLTNSFYHYYHNTVFRPASTFERLIADNRMLRFGFYAVAITAILYTLVYLFLIFGDGRPFKPWLSIPLEVYYRYNVFFCATSMLLGWLLAAAVVHTLCRMGMQAGSFEQTLAVFGFGISIASWTTGVHDVVTSLLGGIHMFIFGSQAKACFFYLPYGIPRMIMHRGCAAALGDFM